MGIGMAGTHPRKLDLEKVENHGNHEEMSTKTFGILYGKNNSAT